MPRGNNNNNNEDNARGGKSDESWTCPVAGCGTTVTASPDTIGLAIAIHEAFHSDNPDLDG